MGLCATKLNDLSTNGALKKQIKQIEVCQKPLEANIQGVI